MAAGQKTASTLAALAKQLEGDILARGLQPGERYRTAAEASLILGVSPATADRAMNLLVRRGYLTREQGRGTFIGDAIGRRQKRTRVRVVYVLLAEDQKDVTSVQLEDLIDAVRSRISDSNVQFCFVPETDPVGYVRE